MRALMVATSAGLFSIPIYLMALFKSPESIASAFLIWFLLLMFFWKFFDDEGKFHG